MAPSNDRNNIADLLPGLAGPAPRNRRRGSGARIFIFLLLLSTIAGGGYWLYKNAALFTSSQPENAEQSAAPLSSIAEDMSPANEIIVDIPDKPKEKVTDPATSAIAKPGSAENISTTPAQRARRRPQGPSPRFKDKKTTPREA